MFEPVEIKLIPHPPITYVCSDGYRTTNKHEASVREKLCTRMRMDWYNKRYSLRGEIMYFLFKKEPKKPYKF